MPHTKGLNRVAIVGAGAVGATIAYAAMIRGIAPQIVLYDIDKPKVHAETLDLNHGLQFAPMAAIEGSDDVAICKDATVIVITAGAKQKPGQSRLDLAAANCAMLRTIVPQLQKVAPEAIFLLVTNPVDVMTQVTLRISGLPRNRVFGSGTVLDSSRFRFLIARRLKVAVQNVHANIAGEHGDSEIPLWSSATVGGIPLHEWAVKGHGSLSVRDRSEIFQDVKTAAHQIIEGKGATNYAIALATAQILDAILRDQSRVLSVSSMIEKFGEIAPEASPAGDVCMSLPCIVNKSGVELPLPIPLNPAETAGLANSAATIKAALAAVGFG